MRKMRRVEENGGEWRRVEENGGEGRRGVDDTKLRDVDNRSKIFILNRK
jgi:hypothetical protein